jgi:hypothetical protein
MERIVSFRERARRAAVAAAAAAGNSENAARVRASTIANAEAWLLSECTKVVDVLGGEEMDFEVKQNSSGNFILGEKTSLGGAGGTSRSRFDLLFMIMWNPRAISGGGIGRPKFLTGYGRKFLSRFFP